MANRKISEDALLAAADIDGAADYLPLVDASAADAGQRNKRSLLGTIADWAVKYSTSFVQSGTATPETIEGFLQRIWVPVTSYMSDAQKADYAAKTATLDMTVAIQAAAARVQALGGGVLWWPPGKARVFSTTTGTLCDFSDLDGIACLGYGATVEVWTGKTITASEGEFFKFDNCKNILVDGFLTDGPTLDVSQATVKGYEFVRCVNGCRNITVRARVKNMIAGFISSKLVSDADSMRSQNIELDLDIENCWYGANGQYSGDFTRAKVRTNGVHRSFFYYGASHLKADVWSKNHKAVDVLLAASEGVTMEDVSLNYVSGTDSDACADAQKIQLYFGGTTAAILRDIEINVNDVRAASGTTGGASVFITKLLSNGTPDTVDRGHKLQNLKISGSLTGTPSYNSGGGFVMDTLATWGTGDFFSNLSLENLRIDGSDSKSQILLTLANLTDHILLKNVYTPSYITLRQSAADPKPPHTGRVLLENVSCTNRWATATAQPLDNLSANGTPLTVQVGWSGKTLNNLGVGGNNEWDLPAAVPGLEYTFVRADATVIDIDPNGTEIIRGGTAGQMLRGNTDGNMVKLACYVAGTWEIVHSQAAFSYV